MTVYLAVLGTCAALIEADDEDAARDKAARDFARALRAHRLGHARRLARELSVREASAATRMAFAASLLQAREGVE